MRFIETVLLSTHETLHVKKYTLYSESNVSYILFDTTDASMYEGFWKVRIYGDIETYFLFTEKVA